MASKDYNIAKKTVQDEMKEILEGLNTNLSGTLTASAVKKVQSGIIPSQTKTSNYETFMSYMNNKYTFYIDVPIEAVSDIYKCHVEIQEYDYSGSQGRYGVLTSTTNLRIYTHGDSNTDEKTINSAYRWEVTEYC